MKKITTIFLILAIAFLLFGCGCEETKEYELLTLRMYEEIEEDGLFTTKRNSTWYIEYTYKTENGVKIYAFPASWNHEYEIGEENKVVLYEGDFYPTLVITLDKYKELFEISEVTDSE